MTIASDALPQKVVGEFDPIGGVYPGNPAIAGLSDGGFVVTSMDYGEGGWSMANLQVFDATGAKVGAQTFDMFPVGDITVAGLTNGGFVVTWVASSGFGATRPYSIKALLFDATGTGVGILVDTTAAGDPRYPTVTGLSDDGFVIAWNAGGEIRAQVFSASGAKVGSQLLVNTTTAGQQIDSSITGLSNGGFVIAWTDASGVGGDSSGDSVKAQLFDATGTKVGSEFLVNSATAGHQSGPSITSLSNGQFVIAWTDASGVGGDSSDNSIKAQLFDANGTKVGIEFLVNSTTADDQAHPQVASLSNGGFVITWVDSSGQGGDSSGSSVKVQVFDATGAKVGSEFLVNTTWMGNQDAPVVTGLTDGDFVVSWVDGAPTGGLSNPHIKARILGMNDSAPIITTASTQTVAEGTTIVAALISTDPDRFGIDPAMFTISGGANAALFDIVGANLVFKQAPDFESDPHSYQVEVSANDDVNTTAKLITVNLTDVNEAPTAVAVINALPLIVEGVSTTSHLKVADISVADDALGTNILSLVGADAATFEIVGSTLYLKAGTVVDFENKTSYAVAVIVDDPTVGVVPDSQSTTYVLPVADIVGVTINGTLDNDTINETTTVAGQPTPTDERDVIYAGAGNDTIDAAGGNDLIDGGVGDDALTGGAGDDIYVIDSTSDLIIENPNEGNDIVYAFVDYAIGPNVEAVVLQGTGNFNAAGNGSANALVGNSGNNALDGKGGSDYMVGAAGNDIYVIDSTGEAVIENPNEGNDIIYAAVDYTIGPNIESVVLIEGAGNINASGSNDVNALVGNSGNNTLDGKGGNDTMIGGAGNDIYFVDSTGEAVIESPNEGNDIVYASVDYTIGPNVESVVLIEGAGNINAAGSSQANALVGNSGNNTLDGKGGDDTMIGGAGNDIYFVDSTSDLVVESLNQGNDIVYVSVDYTIGPNVESLVLMGVGNVNGSGNGVANALIGNSGNNVLDGHGGQDFLYGNGGNDVFQFRAGEAAGDLVADFSGNGAGPGDGFQFIGFGTAAQGATFTQIGATNQWTIHSGLDLHNEVITLQNGAAVDGSDYVFL